MALIHNTNSIVTSGLVLALDAANTKSYPGSGTTWRDLSGNGNNGTLVNSPTYSSANGGSLVFNHTNYINLGDPASLRFGTGDWSFECWLKINSLSYGGSDAITIASKGYSSGFEVFWYGGVLSTWIANTNTSYGISSDWAINTWYHIVFSKISGVYTVYKNANYYSQSSNTSNISATGISWFIGARSGDGSLAFDGSIPVARMYNKGLSTAEISQNYNALKSRYGLT